MGVRRHRKARSVEFRSDWLPPYGKKIPAGLVVNYVTHDEHRGRDGNVYPRGTPCRATRSPSGDLCLLFFGSRSSPFEMVAVWLAPGAGLCGVEPNVCDPMKENQAYVKEVIAGVDARVSREIREEVEMEQRQRAEREGGILSELSRRVMEDLVPVVVDALERVERRETPVEQEDDGEH